MSEERNGLNQPAPYPEDAEKSVLGSMLRDNTVIDDVVQIVRGEDFYMESHQRIFWCIVELHEAQHPADAVALADALHKRQWIEDVGGYAKLAELWEAAPTAANAEYYAKIVKDRSQLRGLIRVATAILKGAYSPTGPAAELIGDAEKQIYALAEHGHEGQAVPIAVALDELFKILDMRHEGINGIETGFTDLDKIKLGFRTSELVVIGARPSTGKTALACAFAEHAAMAGHPVFFVSLEQSRQELAERMLCAMAEVDGHILKAGPAPADIAAKLLNADNDLHNAPLYIDDTPGQTLTRICANARRLKRRQRIEMVIIDYLQLIVSEDRRIPRHEQVSHMTSRLKNLARELEIPVIILAQLNRESEQDNRAPRMSDLRESGAIEQDADAVFLLWKPQGDGDAVDVVQVKIAKNRNGKRGDIYLAFRKACTRFENYAEEPVFPRQAPPDFPNERDRHP